MMSSLSAPAITNTAPAVGRPIGSDTARGSGGSGGGGSGVEAAAASGAGGGGGASASSLPAGAACTNGLMQSPCRSRLRSQQAAVADEGGEHEGREAGGGAGGSPAHVGGAAATAQENASPDDIGWDAMRTTS